MRGEIVNTSGFADLMSLLQVFNSAAVVEGKYLVTTESSAVYTSFIMTPMATFGDVYDDIPFDL